MEDDVRSIERLHRSDTTHLDLALDVSSSGNLDVTLREKIPAVLDGHKAGAITDGRQNRPGERYCRLYGRLNLIRVRTSV